MHFASWSDFFAMGGYGLYVWSSVGFTLISMLWLLAATLLRHRRLLKEVRKKLAREERLRKAQKMENTL